MKEASENNLSYQKKDQLNRNIDKPKEASNKDVQTNTQSSNTNKVSFHDTLSLLPPPFNPTLETEFLKKLSLDDENSNPSKHPFFIPITSNDKLSLYCPWQQAIIIKLLGKKISYTNLKTKLNSIWQLDATLQLMDVGYDFYLIKLQKLENYNKIY